MKTLKLFLLTLMLLGMFQSNLSAGTTEQTAFVERFYQNIMGRTADSGGMNTWLNVIQTESATKVALGFFKSQEFLNKNLPNEQFVDILYQTLFDRQGDTDGRNGWLNQLNSGTSKDEVMYGFFNAQEFKNLADRFGVTQIRPEDQLNAGTAGIGGYVKRFYLLVLNREADASGFEDWTNQLNTGTKAGGDIAKGFFNSAEYNNRGLDNSTFLDICYRAFFNREADSGGKSNWTTQLNQGATKDAVLDGFIDSQEFITLANGFGIKNRLVANNGDIFSSLVPIAYSGNYSFYHLYYCVKQYISKEPNICKYSILQLEEEMLFEKKVDIQTNDLNNMQVTINPVIEYEDRNSKFFLTVKSDVSFYKSSIILPNTVNINNLFIQVIYSMMNENLNQEYIKGNRELHLWTSDSIPWYPWKSNYSFTYYTGNKEEFWITASIKAIRILDKSTGIVYYNQEW